MRNLAPLFPWWIAAGLLAMWAVRLVHRAHHSLVVERVATLRTSSDARIARQWRTMCRRAGVEPQSWLRTSLFASGVGALLVMGAGLRAVCAAVVVVWAGRGVALVRAARRELDRVEAAVPALLESVAAELRAGATVPGAVFAAGSRTTPVARSFAGVARATAVGEPFLVALRRWSTDVPRPGVIAATAACSVAFEAGGNLAPVLEQLAQTLRDRAGAEAEVRTQATQARLSAWVVGVAPLVSLGVFAALDPQTMVAFVAAPAGRLALSVACVCEVLGVWCIARIVRGEP